MSPSLTDSQQKLLKRVIAGLTSINPDEREDANYLESLNLIWIDDIGWETLAFPTDIAATGLADQNATTTI